MSGKMTATATAPALKPIKVVEPTSLIERIKRIHEAIERRAYEIFEGKGGFFNDDLNDWFKAEAELLHPVHIDLTETDAALTLTAEVPSFEAGELEISVEPSRIMIAGKRESKKEEKAKGRTIYTERRSDEILRILDLPAEVDSAKTTATLKDGILNLTMPKITSKKKQIAVKAA